VLAWLNMGFSLSICLFLTCVVGTRGRGLQELDAFVQCLLGVSCAGPDQRPVLPTPKDSKFLYKVASAETSNFVIVKTSKVTSFEHCLQRER
jgi:hypothetical protein